MNELIKTLVLFVWMILIILLLMLDTKFMGLGLFSIGIIMMAIYKEVRNNN